MCIIFISKFPEAGIESQKYSFMKLNLIIFLWVKYCLKQKTNMNIDLGIMN